MSIVTTLPVIQSSSLTLRGSKAALFGAFLSALLTPVSLLILGFHPNAEDGGLYLAGVKYLLTPSLFPHLRQFVTAPLQYSAFASCTAFLIRHSSLSFDHVVFGMFLACVWATIFAAWSIAQTCFGSLHEQSGATLLVALWMSLPVAGTSLMLVDPYLTARSFSTPFVLFALASVLSASAARRFGRVRKARYGLAWAALWLLLATIFHPLMAGYGVVFVTTCLWMESPRPSSTAVKAAWLCVVGLLLAAAMQALSPPPTTAVVRVSLTRMYWFLAQWKWFELLGLLAPLLILVAMLRLRLFRGFRPLALSALTVGATSVAISVCFARSTLRSFGVAHLQPLRVFQVIYFILFLAIGAWLARVVLRNIWWRWALAVACLSAPVMIPAWVVFPHSAHIELTPANFRTPDSNRWVEAFRWIQHNTPADAFFAIDADYISDPDDDAQSFRAIAERSVLPDYSKDGGEAAVSSSLSEEWARGVDVQEGLSRQNDGFRQERLRGLAVTWMVLQSDAHTASSCPYDNGTVKVCKVDSPLRPPL